MDGKIKYKVDKRDLMRVKSCKDLKVIEKILENVFLEGLKAQVGEDYIVDNENRYLHVKRGTQYSFVCPHCGEENILDFESLLEEQGGMNEEPGNNGESR